MAEQGYYNLNPYHVLQVDETATCQEVREKYLMLSKTFHPDKQPNSNYDFAKEYFFKIDSAYKALSTPLRRYAYEQFGIKGIELIEKYPYEFDRYKNSIDQVESQEEVKELLFYLLFVREVDFEEELTKTENVTYISAIDATSKTYRFGKNQSHTISFSMTAPEVAHFQNTLEMDVENTFGRDTQTIFRCYSSRRLWAGRLKGVLIKNSFLIWGSGISEELNLSVNVSRTISLRVSPIVYESGSLQLPKVGIQKAFDNDVNFQAETNGSYVSMEVGKSEEQTSKHLNFEFFQNMFNVTTGYQRQIDKSCRLLAGLMLSGNSQEGNFLNLSLGYYYGVRLQVGAESKLQLRSVFGQHNHLDLRISKGKYNIRIPIYCEGVDVIAFEVAKLGVILATYVIHRILSQSVRKTKTRRERLLTKHHSRLTQDQNKVRRMVFEANNSDATLSLIQLRANGLLILKALYGSKTALRPYVNQYSKKSFAPSVEELENFRNLDEDKFSNHTEEIYDVTKLVQCSVLGAQLIDYLPVNIPNPCIDSNQQPVLFIAYCLRGQRNNIVSDLKRPLSIGVSSRKKANNVVSRILAWVNRHLM